MLLPVLLILTAFSDTSAVIPSLVFSISRVPPWALASEISLPEINVESPLPAFDRFRLALPLNANTPNASLPSLWLSKVPAYR